MDELYQNRFLIYIKRVVDQLGALYEKIPLGVQLYPQIATIIAVNDPDDKGRAKVTYSDAPTEVSEWIEVLGFHSGNLPAQYIGSRMVSICLNGNPEDAVLIGTVMNDLDMPVSSSPIMIPAFDEQLGNTAPTCNEDLEGMMMVFTNTISSDLKVCIRRNSITQDAKDPKKLVSVYSWKSITNALQILKGEYAPPPSDTPGAIPPKEIAKKGVKKCTVENEGETFLFSEDRSLRQVQMTCKKMPGGTYVWMNTNSPSVYVRTLVPECVEELQGLEIIIDDGYNSQLALCLRRETKMQWMEAVMKGSSFFPKDPLPEQELSSIVENVEAKLLDGYFDTNPLNTIKFSDKFLGSTEVSDLLKLVESLVVPQVSTQQDTDVI